MTLWRTLIVFTFFIMQHVCPRSSTSRCLQADWQTLRADHPHLSPAQLHNVLSKYSYGGGRQRPDHWQPSPADREQALAQGMRHSLVCTYSSLLIEIRCLYSCHTTYIL